MHNLRLAILLCLFMGLYTNTAYSDDAELRAVFDGRYATLKSAMATRDEKEITSLLATGFTSVDIVGKEKTAAQMVQELQSLPQDPHKESNTTILSVKVSGDTAVVEQRYNMKTSKTGADGVKKDVELTALSTDTWVSVNGAWLLRRTMTNQIDYSINGKSVIHKVRAPGP
jgi:hypothetical protein